ncbi:MAG: hypothetical protein HZB51_09800 [Chloroflexi bacterium]|nr:hypothetical protein [Chloroflexota bacterium]
MNRDFSERIDHVINASILLNRLAKGMRGLLDKIFLNGPLQPIKHFLNGRWLGHPLHPVLTDVPIGAWLIVVVLDVIAVVFGVPNLGFASGLIALIGILGAVATIASGFMDWQDVGARELTVGLTHGLINATGTILFQ